MKVFLLRSLVQQHRSTSSCMEEQVVASHVGSMEMRRVFVCAFTRSPFQGEFPANMRSIIHMIS